jgi:hypothetical protein
VEHSAQLSFESLVNRSRRHSERSEDVGPWRAFRAMNPGFVHA